MNNLLSLFSFLVIAAETIVSPLPNELINTPTKSFGMITASVVLGSSTTLPTETPTPTKPSISKQIKIAVLGDSMVDTLGPGFPALKETLLAAYPNVQAEIINYGAGGTNIDYGIERITSDYEYLGQKIPALASMNPDIVVIESFGYNPYSYDEGALNAHWLALAKAVDTIKERLPNARIIIATTIAPNSQTFADGAKGLSFTLQEKQAKVSVIKSYLESTIRFAKGEKLPLADAYTPSLEADGNGNPLYINPGDNIHPSDQGKLLFAQTLVNTIQEHNMLE